MIPCGSYNAYVGDFHTHWYWDLENPTLLIAGMRSMGADFITLCYHAYYNEIGKFSDIVKKYELPFRIFPGKELTLADGHIVCWIDETFDPSKYSDTLSFMENLKELKKESDLVILAHPSPNWRGSFDDTYSPLLSLCKEGLIDAVQIESAEPFNAIVDAGLNFSFLGGFDIHACSQLKGGRQLAFNRKFNALEHIIPCSPYLSVVLAEDLEESSIIAAVKAGRCAVFNTEKKEILGRKEIVHELENADFYTKWRELCRANDNIEISGRILAGIPSSFDITVDGKPAETILFSPESIESPFEYKSSVGSFKIDKVSLLLDRDSYYAPLTVKAKGYSGFFGVLIERCISLNAIPAVRNNNDCVEFYLLNRSNERQDIEVELFIEQHGIRKKAQLSLAPSASVMHRLFLPEILNFGNSFESEISVSSDSFNFMENKILSFPVCRRITNSETPWRIDRNHAIVFGDKYIDRKPFWHGPADFSCSIDLAYDDESFYLYAEVLDDCHFQEWTGWETFWGDCIQFAFQTGIEKEDAYGKNYEFAMALTKNGPELFLWNAPGRGQVREQCCAADLKIERCEKTKITFYKLSLPWTFLGDFIPATGRQFLFSALVIDNDGDVTQRKWMFYGENIAVRKSMANAHCVTLE